MVGYIFIYYLEYLVLTMFSQSRFFTMFVLN